jgi:hypothetical protein
MNRGWDVADKQGAQSNYTESGLDLKCGCAMEFQVHNSLGYTSHKQTAPPLAPFLCDSCARDLLGMSRSAACLVVQDAYHC